MAPPLRERAKKYGYRKDEVNILAVVTGWFNGRGRDMQDRRINIGTAHEPPLPQLYRSDWTRGLEEAHQHLIDSGVFKAAKRDESVHIAGRRCRWIPTERFMTVVEDILDGLERVYPPWRDRIEHHMGQPTFRDGPELMEHRKGVLASIFLFQKVDSNLVGRPSPAARSSVRPDFELRWGSMLIRGEVLRENHNFESWEHKFDEWADDDIPTIWIFENRTAMVRFWNYLRDKGYVELDGGRFSGKANNWSPKRVNDRLRRSRRGAVRHSSHNSVWTIAGVLGADRADGVQFLKRNNII